MTTRSPSRILILAHGTTRDPALLHAVTTRARHSSAEFTLLVPAVAHGLHRVVDPEDHCCAEAQATLDAALPLLRQATDSPVTGMIGAHEPLAAVQDALNLHGFDEVIVSTLPSRLSRWLHVDLPRKIAALGVPVTSVTARHAGESYAA